MQAGALDDVVRRPVGLDRRRLPAALQMVGPWYAEPRLYALAARIEAARPWAHRRPPEAS